MNKYKVLETVRKRIQQHNEDEFICRLAKINRIQYQKIESRQFENRFLAEMHGVQRTQKF
jgi:2-oxo-4-hydroxy-4-carboxy--5-ureidoimidazoline (OHCU) decarboxylase